MCQDRSNACLPQTQNSSDITQCRLRMSQGPYRVLDPERDSDGGKKHTLPLRYHHSNGKNNHTVQQYHKLTVLKLGIGAFFISQWSSDSQGLESAWVVGNSSQDVGQSFPKANFFVDLLPHPKMCHLSRRWCSRALCQLCLRQRKESELQTSMEILY